MRGLPHQIKIFVSVSELNLAKLEKKNSFFAKKIYLKIENKNTKKQSELSTEFSISFFEIIFAGTVNSTKGFSVLFGATNHHFS